LISACLGGLSIGSGTGKAGDETRTRDIFLGKEVLYQLSYTRVKMKDPYVARA
jgi:hypothetical protein